MLKSNSISKLPPKNIYLDYASATPLDARVLSAMVTSFKKDFANPSAIHNEGVKVKKILENMRANIAGILGAHSNEILFTSGATEANNLAIMGTVEATAKKGFVPHIITTNIEHAAVLEVCRLLEKNKKAEVTYVEVEPNGIVDSKKIKKALRPNTVLISVMYANNEIGTIQPIHEIAKEIRHYKKNSKTPQFPVFHSDATQAINYLPINLEKLGVDLLSFNSAKIYGPKGVGVLFKKRNVALVSVMKGGDQEFSLRPGTENVPLVIGLTEALNIIQAIKIKEVKRLITLRDYFIKKIKNLHKGIIVNGDVVHRLPNNVNITIPNIPSDLLVIELSARRVMASAKSACKSGDGKASHVIEAINKDAKDTDGSLRFSLGRETTKADIDYTLKVLTEILSKLKKWYN